MLLDRIWGSSNKIAIQNAASDPSTEFKLPEGLQFNLLEGWRFIFEPKSTYTRLRHKHRDIATFFNTPIGNIVLTFTAEGARQVLTADPEGYGASLKETFTGLGGTGSLLVLEGARHRAERRLLMPAFHTRHLRNIGEVIRDIAITHTDAWRPDQRIKAYNAMLDVSRDVILHIVFGIDSGPLLDEGRAELYRLQFSVHPLTVFLPLFQAWWFPPWRKYKRALRHFSRFVDRCLAERRAAGIESGDVLGLLMTARYDDGSTLSDDEILGEAGTIVMAGHKNMAIALSWALYELARHPAEMKRLRDELEALGPDPDPEVIAKLPYLGAVCDETLRVHPIHTEVGRVCKVPLSLLGYTLPTDTCVAVAISAIHHDPAIYPEPEKFRPERFIERSYSPFEFLPYGGGHRRCIGAAFSDYQMRIMLATVVMRWELEAIGEEGVTRHNLGMGPKRRVPMRIKARRQN